LIDWVLSSLRISQLRGRGESKVKKTLLLCVECEEKKMGVFFLFFFLFFYGEREFESLDREREKQDKKTGKHK
jgi:hypothetical protein